ncbi:flavin-containing monooxygenase [Bacillus sp. PS06]|uniref:flavin-containing monooxygenase n=1 Tax=Bacillus sp. PS06 TaxID=2764176 RepID=UPI00177D1ADA|nr:NAD(P)/FAD-dependent oxidoreductase [Bacillus sp. PS06]MBD8070673.1 NAD(P)-binding domain-containing protein [Bacillus sp. PS06]
MDYDVLIIGAGQAGLSMGYYLKKSDLSFIVVDKVGQIGDVWRTRYDSLTLFTPRMYSSLPGQNFSGEQQGYPTKDEVASYLESYVKTCSIPIQLNTVVEKVSKIDHGFEIMTNQGTLNARNVIVATGPFQTPAIPMFAEQLSPTIFQIHSSQYKNPEQLTQGSVLVVGGGNSGAQIALEISMTRKTYLSVAHKLKFLPQDIGNKSIFWYFDKLGIYQASENSVVGRLLKQRPDPIFGDELKSSIKNGNIILKPRTKSIRNDQILFEDDCEIKVDNVIWATGFKSDYHWIELPHLFNEQGQPIHKRGITSIEGFFFLGLSWQSSRGSALLQGVGKDAKYIYHHIIESRESR